MRRVAALLCTVLFCAGCSEPPQKEIDHAQGALDAARAAGAERYAGAELAEASAALQQSHDAVTQRDYRLALSRALDASQRAQDAARQAADGKARARSAAESDIHDVETAVQELEATLASAPGARTSDAELRAARQAVIDGRRAVQKARESLMAGEYLEAAAVMKGVNAQISAQNSPLDDAARAKTLKRRR